MCLLQMFPEKSEQQAPGFEASDQIEWMPFISADMDAPQKLLAY